jgi:integrase
MPRTKTGCVVKRPGRKGLWAVITYEDENGSKKQSWRKVATRTEGKELNRQRLEDIKKHGPQTVEGERVTFERLARIYEENELVPATYRDGKKVSGLRSLSPAKSQLKKIVEYFGSRKIKSITPNDLKKFKAWLLNNDRYKEIDKEKPETERADRGKLSITSADRVLKRLRTFFNYAKGEGWVVHSPFEHNRAKGLISKADEKRRVRVLKIEEERRMLKACATRCQHIRPIVICALDTAMRKGEILKLRWRDVGFDSRKITVIAMNAKTAKPREIGITARLYAELERLWQISPLDPDGLVFGIKSDFKKAWESVKGDAEINDFHFHDCRHTCITRWVAKGMTIEQIKPLSGHSSTVSLDIYINTTDELIRQGAEVLNQFFEEWHTAKPANQFVN